MYPICQNGNCREGLHVDELSLCNGILKGVLIITPILVFFGYLVASLLASRGIFGIEDFLYLVCFIVVEIMVWIFTANFTMRHCHCPKCSLGWLVVRIGSRRKYLLKHKHVCRQSTTF